jgi:hypothetical protein
MNRLFKAPLYGAACLVLSVLAVPFLGAGVAHAAGPDPQGTIYVADYGASAIDVFPPGTNGNVAPERVISGPNTGIDGPADVKVDSAGDVFVSNFNSDTITEYAPQASGDTTPTCTISGPNTGLDENDDMSLEADGTLIVGNFDAVGGSGSVVVFSPGACGDAAPVETIEGPNTGLNVVDGVGTDASGTIYADSTDDSSIQVFPAGANGNVAPSYSISGSNTGLDAPDDVIVGFDGQLYVTNGGNSVTVYAPGASGNATPVQDISGSNTGFVDVDDLGVDTSENIYVADFEAADVPIFAAGSTGNVAPEATIGGSLTGFVTPEGVVVAGPPQTSSATLTTQASASSISLGQSTFDTATLAGGTSPTGSMVFKLFGPNDATCSAAPAYTSPSQPVTGDGAYPSPSFAPTATGTYYWQALYSGDSNNAAITTPCGVPAETVTVTSTCDTGPWPSQVNGVPTVNPNEARGFYIGVDPDNGQWTLENTHMQSEPRDFYYFDATITTDGTFSGVTPIMLENHDSITVSPDQHTLTYLSQDGGSIDGVSFTPTCGSMITFSLTIKEAPALTRQIYLGVPATHPSTNPVTFTRSS